MGGTHSTKYDVFRYYELNNRKKEEEKLKNKKQDRKEMAPHETYALKVLEHVTEKGISIDKYNNNQLNTLFIWNVIKKSKQVRLAENMKKWKDIQEKNKKPPANKKWMQQDKQKLLRLRSHNIQIEDMSLRRHKKTQVCQF